MKTLAAKSRATPPGQGQALTLDVLVVRLVGPWGKVALRKVRARMWSFVMVWDHLSVPWGVACCHFGSPSGSFVHFVGRKLPRGGRTKASAGRLCRWRCSEIGNTHVFNGFLTCLKTASRGRKLSTSVFTHISNGFLRTFEETCGSSTMKMRLPK